MTAFSPQTHYSLLSHNTFGIEAFADYYVEYDSPAQLARALAFHRETCPSLPLLHIGGGSNLLFLGDFHGMVLHSAIRGIEVRHVDNGSQTVVVRVGAATNWDEWVAYSLSQGWYGLENLSLIPGEVGASAVQNIGAYGAEAADFIQGVTCVDLRDATERYFPVGECGYGYRKSVFKTQFSGRFAVTHVDFCLSLRFEPNVSYRGVASALQSLGKDAEHPTADDVRQAVIHVRRQKLPDPAKTGNAGSFFMNPVIPRSQYLSLTARFPDMPSYVVDDTHVKVPAAWLIDQCGWKGRRQGTVGVHDAQPLVLLNLGGATGAEVRDLCRSIQHDVQERFGISLVPEVLMI